MFTLIVEFFVERMNHTTTFAFDMLGNAEVVKEVVTFVLK